MARGGNEVMEGQLDAVRHQPREQLEKRILRGEKGHGRDEPLKSQLPAEPLAPVALFRAPWGSGFALACRGRGCPPGRDVAGRFSSAGRWPKGRARCSQACWLRRRTWS